MGTLISPRGFSSEKGVLFGVPPGGFGVRCDLACPPSPSSKTLRWAEPFFWSCGTFVGGAKSSRDRCFWDQRKGKFSMTLLKIAGPC